MMKMKHLPFVAYIVFMALFIAIGYRQLPYLYYLNDAWLTYGEVSVYGIKGFLATQSWWLLPLGIGRPLGTLINNIFMLLFPLNPLPFALTSYVVHFTNGVLLWILMKKLTKHWYAPFFGGLFFISLSVYHQAFSWMSNSVQVSCSACFSLVSIILLLKSIEQRKNKFFYLSWLAAYIAFLFKETAIFLFLLLPVMYKIFGNAVSVKEVMKKHALLIIGGVMVVVYRLTTLPSVTGIATATVAYWKHVIANILYYPVISLSQIFIPRDFMFKMVPKFGEQMYPNVMASISASAPVYENITTDVVSLLLFSVIIFIGLQYYMHYKKQRKNMLCIIVFYVSTFVPLAAYLFIRGTSYIESRYMYLPAIPMSMFIGCIAHEIIQLIRLIKNKSIRIMLLSVVALSFLLFCFKQATVANHEVGKSVSFGNETKAALGELKRLYPKLPVNTIIYMTGDVSYYGLPNHRLPLQLGTGYIIQVIYFQDGTIPASFIKNRFLWQLQSQGYNEEQGVGFGFFDDKEQLITFFDMNPNKKTDDIIGLYYYGNDKKMIDISKQLREEVQSKR